MAADVLCGRCDAFGSQIFLQDVGSLCPVAFDPVLVNVFLSAMKDEVVPTGLYPMAHYLFALCCDRV